MARELDMAPQTLARIVGTSSTALVPVRVVAEPARERTSFVVHGPRGIVVEGLGVDGLADLIRALS